MSAADRAVRDGNAGQCLVIRGAAIASADSPKLTVADVAIEDGIISRLGMDIGELPSAREINGSGMVLLPGMFDMHVHFREPGQEWKETIATGSEAAINGGVTGVVAMPNTVPAIDNGGMVQSILEIAGRNARIDVHTAGCITKDRAGKDLAAIADMREKGALLITEGGVPVSNPLVMRRAMEYARDFELIVGSHCETLELSGKGAMNEGPVSFRLGIPGMPSCSEEIALARDLRLAQFTGAHVHLQHVSTARGMETVRRYKGEGVKVSCAVTPHHLIFSEEDIGDYDTNFKMTPPLRTREDCARLIEGLKEGVFDVIATDHAPHAEFEKQQDFASAPFGITGLETALISLHHHFVREGVFGWDVIVRHYSVLPRRLLKLPVAEIREGAAANCVLFDPDKTTRIDREWMRSMSSNTPFLGRELRGSVEHVIFAGKLLK